MKNITWNPIQSAPKDGRYMLLAGKSGYRSTPLRVEVGHWDGKWWRNHSADHFTDGGPDPIYWLPLPDDPYDKMTAMQLDEIGDDE